MLLKIVAVLTLLSAGGQAVRTRDKLHSNNAKNILAQIDADCLDLDEEGAPKCKKKEGEPDVVFVEDGEGTDDYYQQGNSDPVLEKGPGKDEGENGELDLPNEVDYRLMPRVGAYLEKVADTNDFFVLKTGLAKQYKDVALSPDNSIWAVDEDENIWFCKNERCAQIDGSAVSISVDTDGVVYIVNSQNEIYKREGPAGDWEQLKGEAYEICARNNVQYILTKTDYDDGKSHGVAHKKTEDEDWTETDGTLAHIACDSRGLGAGIGAYDGIWVRNDADSLWGRKPGAGKDISIGHDDSIFVVGNNADLFFWNKDTTRWIRIKSAGSVEKIDVKDLQNIVLITSDGKLATNAKYERPKIASDHLMAQGYIDLLPFADCFGETESVENPSGVAFTSVDKNGPKEFIDASIADDGTVWAIGSDESIWFNKRTAWHQVEGAAVKVSVDTDKTVWVVNRDGNIYKRDGIEGSWENVGGSAIDIAARAGNVIITTPTKADKQGGKILYLSKDGGDWEKVEGLHGTTGAVDTDGLPILVTVPGGLWKRSESEEEKGWEAISGCVSQISVAHDGTLYAIGKKGGVYIYDKDADKWTQVTGLDENEEYHRIDGKDKSTFVVVSKQGKVHTNFVRSTSVPVEDGEGTSDNGQDNNSDVTDEVPDETANATPDLEVEGDRKPDFEFIDNIAAYKENLSGTGFYHIHGAFEKVLDAAYSPDGILWVIDADQKIYWCKVQDCKEVDGSAVSIACDSDGMVYVANSEGNLFRRQGPAGQWEPIQGSALDIQARGGVQYIVTKDDSENGAHAIQKKTTDDDEWSDVAGHFKKVGINSQGKGYGIANENGIWQRNEADDGWKRIIGAAKQIGVGFDDSVYIVGSNDMLYYFNQKTGRWILITGVDEIRNIDVLDHKHIAVITWEHKLYTNYKRQPRVALPDHDIEYGYYDLVAYPECFEKQTDETQNPSSYEIKALEQDGTPKWIDASIGSDGILWATGEDQSIWYFKKGKWIQVDGSASKITVDTNRDVWVVNNGGGIYRRAGISGQWKQIGGAASDIAARNQYVVHVSHKAVDGDGGHGLYISRAGSPWAKVGGFNFVTPAVTDEGVPVGITAGSGIWKRNDDQTGWNALVGCAVDLSIAHDGTYYALTKDGEVYFKGKESSEWTKVTGTQGEIVRIDGMNKDTFVTVNKEGKIYTNFDPKQVQRDLPPVVREIADGDELDSEDNEDVSYWMDRAETLDKIEGEEDFRVLEGGDPQGWTDVAVTPDGIIWATGANQGIWYYKDSWVKVDGAAVRVTADSNGDIWVANAGYAIFRREGPNQGWAQFAGGAFEIAARGGNVVYLTGNNYGNLKYSVYKKVANPDSQSQVPGAVAQIATTTDGKYQAIGAYGGIFARNEKGWFQRPGAATDVCTAYDDSLFYLFEGYIYRYDEAANKFIKFTGLTGVRKVEAISQTKIVAIAEEGKILVNFHRTIKTTVTDDEISRGYADLLAYPKGFEGVSNEVENTSPYEFKLLDKGGAGKWQDVSVGANGIIWAMGQDQSIWYYWRKRWAKMDGAAVKVSVDSNNEVWVVNNGGSIYKRKGINGGWTGIAGAASDIAARNRFVIHTSQAVVDDAGGHNLWLSKQGSGWSQVTGFTASTPSVDIDGLAIALTTAGGIWKRTEGNKGWAAIEGIANDISVAHDGTLYVTGKDKLIYSFNRETQQWTRITGAKGVVRVDGFDKEMYVFLDEDGFIWSTYGTPQKDLGPNVRQIPADTDLDNPELDDLGYWMDKSGQEVESTSSEPFREIAGARSGEWLDCTIGVDGTIMATATDYSIWYYREEKWVQFEGQAAHITLDGNGDVWVSNQYNAIYRRPGISGGWQGIPGMAYDIVARNGAVYHMGGPPFPNGRHNIYRRVKGTDFNWEQYPGQVNQIATGNDGQPQAIGPFGAILAVNDQGWFQRPGSGSDIVVGTDNTLFVLYNSFIYRYNEADNTYTKITGSGQVKKFDSWDKENLVVITSEGKLLTNSKQVKKTTLNDDLITRGYVSLNPLPDFEVGKEVENTSPYQFRSLPGGAGKWQDVAIGNDGTIMGMGVDGGIWYYRRNRWTQLDGAAVRVSMDTNGNIWVVNGGGGIYKRENLQSGWQGIPGAANDISARNQYVLHTSAGTVDSAGARGLYIAKNGGGWSRVAGFNGILPSVDSNGLTYTLSTSNGIWTRTEDQKGWSALSGNAIDLSVAYDGSVWAVGKDRTIYVLAKGESKWTRVTGIPQITRIDGKDGKMIAAVDQNGVLWTNYGVDQKDLPPIVRYIKNDQYDTIYDDDLSYWMDKSGNTVESPGDEPIAALPDQYGAGYIDVTVCPDGTIWAIQKDAVVYYFRESKWTRVDSGGVTKISCDSTGMIWVLVSSGAIYRRAGLYQNWQNIAGWGREISVRNGTVVHIGGGRNGAKQNLWRNKRDQDGAWEAYDGSLNRLAVSPDGTVQGLGDFGGIYAQNSNGWYQRPGAADSLAVGFDGTLFAVFNSYPYRYEQAQNTYTKITGAGKVQKVDSLGRDMIVALSTDGKIYSNVKVTYRPTTYKDYEIKYGYVYEKVYPSCFPDAKQSTNTAHDLVFRKLTGGAGNWADVAFGPDGLLYAISASNGIWYYKYETWTQLDGGAQRITAGNDGAIWVVAGGGIYRRQGITSGWGQIGGAAFDIVARNGRVAHDSQSVQQFGGHTMYRAENNQGNGWTEIPGWQLMSIALTNDGQAIGLTPKGGLWERHQNGDSWQWFAMEGCGVDVATGHDGTLYVAGENGQQFQYNWISKQWVNMPKSGQVAKRIDALNANYYAIVNDKGEIYTNYPIQDQILDDPFFDQIDPDYDDDKFYTEEAITANDMRVIESPNGRPFIDLSYDIDGVLWALTSNTNENNLFKYVNGNWQAYPVNGRRIGFGAKQGWICRDNQDLWWKPTRDTWQMWGYSTTDFGGRSTLYTIVNTNNVYYYIGPNWAGITGRLTAVATFQGKAVGPNNKKALFQQLDDKRWKRMPGRAIDISGSFDDQTIYVLNQKGIPMRWNNALRKFDRFKGFGVCDRIDVFDLTRFAVITNGKIMANKY